MSECQTEKRTHLADEEFAYNGGCQTRPGKAIYPDGIIRRVYAGIPDTFFTIPAHGRVKGTYLAGFLYIEDDFDSPNYGELKFHVYARYMEKDIDRDLFSRLDFGERKNPENNIDLSPFVVEEETFFDD